jgi:uncharacterized protein involved in exopolysaccharide biosynthesis
VLQAYGSSQSFGSNPFPVYEDRSQGLDIGHYVGILKRRIFYFLIPFCIAIILGGYFVAKQKPVYLSEGKLLVESQGIAPDLVRPIVTATANERIQVIQQRIMTRDNLLSIASKFELFPAVQSGTQILELMQAGTQIKLLDLDASSRQGLSTIAITVGFEHESPERAMRVANEFLTLILSEDERARSNRASETVKILESEVKGLEERLDSTQTQMAEIKRRPRDTVPEVPDQEKSQMAALAALKTELIQKAAVYSDAHPAVVALKRRIATMEKTITQSPPAPSTAQTTQADDIEALQRQRQALEKRLDDANSKLATARVGERLEKDQQSGRLQVIEHPTLPQRPVRSGKLKVAGIALALATMVGFGAVFAAEMFDGSIRGSRELAGVVDSHLVISIPYIKTRAEDLRTRRRAALGAGALAAMFLVGLAAVVFYTWPASSSWFDISWLDGLTRSSR